MKAVIMAGGEGNRLRPYTYVIPKPLLPLKDKPILEIIINKLRDQGVEEIILSTNYKSELFEILFGKGENHGVSITYSKEKTPLGTVGPLRLIKEMVDEDFILMNGDILTDLDVGKVMDFHKKNNADITVVTKKHLIPLDFGIVKVENGEIKCWKEKPKIKSEISTGIYIINPSVIRHIPENEKYDMPQLIGKIIEEGGKVSRYLYEGRWIDIGKIEDFEKAQSEILGEFEND